MTTTLVPTPSSRLLMRNPFRGSVQSDAWGTEAAAQDVASIHRAVFDTCCTAVDAVRAGTCSAGIVIHGQAGSGKTHLIGRLRRQFTDSFSEPTFERLSQAFSYVQLNTHYSALKRHTRRCVAIDLLRSFGKGPSQFERLVVTRLMSVAHGGGHLTSWWEFFLEERHEELDDLLIQLGNQESLSTSFVTILGHVIRHQHRLEVAGWLRGDALPDAAYDRLGVAVPNADDDPEQAAQHVLSDLMRLAGPEIPLVLCFDQVEALQVSPNDDQPFFAYAQLITDLYNSDRNLVLISCMQTEFSARLLRESPDFAKARLQSYATCLLTPVDFAEASKLLATRLRLPQSNDNPQLADLAPLTDADLTTFLGRNGHCYPRELLDRAARRFDQLAGQERPERQRPDWLADEWDRRTEEALQANDPSRSEAILRDGLPRLVQVADEHWKSSASKHGVSLDYILTGPEREAQVGVKICEGQDARKLWQPLKTLNSLFPDKIKLQRLVLLRDERLPLSKTAVKAREYLDQLEKKDAQFVRVHPEALAALDVLRGLLADSQAGDLDFDGEAVSAATVLHWLREHLPGSLKELADLLIMPQEVEPTLSVVDRLQETLMTERVVAATEAMTKLNLSLPVLLEAARSRPDLFGVIDGSPAAVFSARLGSNAIGATGDETGAARQ